jgi:hypothetical protein
MGSASLGMSLLLACHPHRLPRPADGRRAEGSQGHRLRLAGKLHLTEDGVSLTRSRPRLLPPVVRTLIGWLERNPLLARLTVDRTFTSAELHPDNAGRCVFAGQLGQLPDLGGCPRLAAIPG